MNDRYNVVYLLESLNDLRDIYTYISDELRVPDTARKQVNRIRKRNVFLFFCLSQFFLVLIRHSIE